MSCLSRSLLLACSVFALSFAIPAPSFADDAAAQQTQTDQSAASKFVQDLGNRAIAIITNKQLTTDQRNAQFSQALSDSFDLKTIGRFVIGRTWNSSTPEQQAEYMDLFKALLIKNYGNRLTLAPGEVFKVVGSRSESDLDTTVNSQITHPDGSKPTTVDWRVRQQNGKTGVLDVIVEGISLSVTQRQEYGSIVQNNGGQIDGLLDTMRSELKDNTVSAAK